MIREEWLEDDESVYPDSLIVKHINYINWIQKHYPEIHKECIDAIIDLKEVVNEETHTRSH